MLTSSTKDLKQGDSKLAWDYMIKMYASLDTTDKNEIRKTIQRIKNGSRNQP